VLTILVLLTLLPIAILIAVPTSRALAQGRTSLVRAGLLAWVLLFWTTTLTLAWPLLTSLAASLRI
jgi:hypothetical protein